jgi:hypothetical protein
MVEERQNEIQLALHPDAAYPMLDPVASTEEIYAMQGKSSTESLQREWCASTCSDAGISLAIINREILDWSREQSTRGIKCGCKDEPDMHRLSFRSI